MTFVREASAPEGEEQPRRSKRTQVHASGDDITPELVQLTGDHDQSALRDPHFDHTAKRVTAAGVEEISNQKLLPSSETPRGKPFNRAASNRTQSLIFRARAKGKKWTKNFFVVKVTQLLCVAYIMILTFSKAPLGLVDPTSGNIIDVTSAENTANGVILVNGDYRPVVAQGGFQKFCLAISRMSAFSMYPVMILVFITKCKATHSFFNSTLLSMFMTPDVHKLHEYAGKFIAFDAWVHTVFHLLRWGNQGNISLLWQTRYQRTGISGLIVILATPLITFPMMYWKVSIPYEIRKGLHYLFYVFAIGMCFHVPPSGIPNGGFIAPILGFCICLYTLDAIYVALFMTEKIDTTIFHVLPSGVQMTMAVSEKFRKRGEQGGFAYVCLPWVDRTQWHAFSLFENPDDPRKRQVFMLKTGDWTNAVHKALERNTVRPVWVQGPFPSPYNHADAYDNQILVATGIGITPALSVIRAHKGSRRINLIWAVRDSAMLEFFLEHLYLDHDGWNLIFYTGKKPLHPTVEELHTNVVVIKKRPNLKSTIPNIIYGIESGAGLPESYTPSEMTRVGQLLLERMIELDNMNGLSENEKLVELAAFANSHGFLFSELVTNLEEENTIDSGKKSSKITQSATEKRYIIRDDELESNKGMLERDDAFFGSYLERLRGLSKRDFQQDDDTCSSSRSLTLKLRKSLSSRSARRMEMFSCGASNRSQLSAVVDYTFKPWEENDVAEDYVKALDKNYVLSTWGILYCGGNKSVEKDLKRISELYSVALNYESFSW